MTEMQYNQRRACALVGIDPRAYRRAPMRPADTELRGWLKELSCERRRFGYPRMVVSDNGTELTSNAILKWQEDRKVEWHYIAPDIAPGKPMQNGLGGRSTAGCGTNSCSTTCAMLAIWRRYGATTSTTTAQFTAWPV